MSTWSPQNPTFSIIFVRKLHSYILFNCILKLPVFTVKSSHEALFIKMCYINKAPLPYHKTVLLFSCDIYNSPEGPGITGCLCRRSSAKSNHGKSHSEEWSKALCEVFLSCHQHVSCRWAEPLLASPGGRWGWLTERMLRRPGRLRVYDWLTDSAVFIPALRQCLPVCWW